MEHSKRGVTMCRVYFRINSECVLLLLQDLKVNLFHMVIGNKNERQKEARFVGELRWHTNILQFIQDELYIVVQP